MSMITLETLTTEEGLNLRKGILSELYVYDINSAYPFEYLILRVGTLSLCQSRIYIPDATYSVFKIRVKIEDKFVSPLLFNNKVFAVILPAITRVL